MQRSTLTVLIAVGASAAAFLAGTSIATSYRPEPPAAKIATVNIQKIFDDLAERKDKLEQLQREAGRMEGEFKAVSDGINAERTRTAALPDGPEKDAKLDAIVDRDVQTQIEIKKAKNKLEKAQADTMRSIFNNIQKKAAAVGDSGGYTMVMAADDWVNISPRASSQEIQQVMSLKRFLSIDAKTHDITAAVLKALNDDYAAAKPATPPAPAGTGATPAPAGTSTPGTPKPAH